MRELFVAQRRYEGEDGRAHHFSYYITIGEMEVAQAFACESYGVRVQEEGGDQQALPNITTSIPRIDALISLLIDNVVAPTGLDDVVEDWL